MEGAALNPVHSGLIGARLQEEERGEEKKKKNIAKLKLDKEH
jgi:hypothetical protein